MSKQFEELYTLFNHRFNNSDILKEALTHPSLSNVLPYNYQRLEFLGDSVLSTIISDYLYTNYPKEKEGGLAKRRARLVSGEVITSIAKKIFLSEYMFLSKGEMRLGRENAKNLENTLEAVIGAIYYDGGFDIAKRFVLENWRDSFKDCEAIPVDPKTQLQESLRTTGRNVPLYVLTEKTGTADKPTYYMRLVVNGVGFVDKSGSSKKEAEKNCAIAMLDKLKIIDDK